MWQQLCRDVGVNVGRSIAQCKRVCDGRRPTAPALTGIVLELARHLHPHRRLRQCEKGRARLSSLRLAERTEHLHQEQPQQDVPARGSEEEPDFEVDADSLKLEGGEVHGWVNCFDGSARKWSAETKIVGAWIDAGIMSATWRNGGLATLRDIAAAVQS